MKRIILSLFFVLSLIGFARASDVNVNILGLSASVDQQITIDTISNVSGASTGQVLTKDSSGHATFQNSSGGGSGTTSYVMSFTNSNLSSGILTVAHNLGQQFCQVTVYDNNNVQIEPSSITATDANDLSINFNPYSITGTWNVVVTK